MLACVARPSPILAQETGQNGTIAGKVVDERGGAVSGAQVFLTRPAIGTLTRPDGGYTLTRVPVGPQSLHVRMLGFRPDSAGVTVTAGQQASQDFTLTRDPLQLEALVVTGTQSPRMNLDASVAVTTLTAAEVLSAAPRSTTEMLRYVPGFTRVESSGGEVNENISIRGILGVEYVAFLEDGLPVFPTMHTFFMNADNLFRFDTNIERLEVVRGGSSPLFGSNTPGAIVNFINKSGGDQFSGTMRATGATKGLARYDLNMNGPFGDDWRFNVGGFYRYDHGVRDPGYPGIRGGQLKGNITRLLEQRLHPVLGQVPRRPEPVHRSASLQQSRRPAIRPGLRRLRIDDHGRGRGHPRAHPGRAADAPVGQRAQDKGHLVHRRCLLRPGPRLAPAEHRPGHAERSGVECDPERESVHRDGLHHGSHGSRRTRLRPRQHGPVHLYQPLRWPTGTPLPFDTPNGLVAAQGEWHIEKPISAVQNQLSLRRAFGKHSLNIGGYFANYTQENRWFFTNILTDVRDQPRFLDLVVTPAGGGAPVQITKDGFRKYIDNYVNGTGQATIVSGVVGGEVQLTERLRADLGVRVEYNDFVQQLGEEVPLRSRRQSGHAVR